MAPAGIGNGQVRRELSPPFLPFSFPPFHLLPLLHFFWSDRRSGTSFNSSLSHLLTPSSLAPLKIIQGIGQAIQDALNGAGTASGGAGAAPVPGTAPVAPNVGRTSAAPAPRAFTVAPDGISPMNP